MFPPEQSLPNLAVTDNLVASLRTDSLTLALSQRERVEVRVLSFARAKPTAS
jgi:hypothetical protein